MSEGYAPPRGLRSSGSIPHTLQDQQRIVTKEGLVAQVFLDKVIECLRGRQGLGEELIIHGPCRQGIAGDGVFGKIPHPLVGGNIGILNIQES